MSDLVARTGRHQQRYEGGCRLVAGCIPFRYRNYDENGDTNAEKIVEVLMINSTSGPGLLFPKRGKVENSNMIEAKKVPCFILRINMHMHVEEEGLCFGQSIFHGQERIGKGLSFSYSLHRGWAALDYEAYTAKRSAFTFGKLGMPGCFRKEEALGFAGRDVRLFKGGWENDETVEEAALREAIEEAGVRGDLMDFIGYYDFKSKTHQDESCPEGLCRAAMFALLVKEELNSWPEQSTRTRSWLTVPDAVNSCRHRWMEDALENFSTWHAGKM